MGSLLKAVSSRERAAALIIVLAFVVLLTGLTLAYFTRTTSDRQVAQSSLNQSKVDQIAATGMDLAIGAFRQEITGTSPTPTPPYFPLPNANMTALRFGTTDSMPNLVRRSVRGDGPTDVNPIPSPGIASLASAVSSTLPSANNRSITLSRWNKHYLVPRPVGADPTDTTPITDANGFTAPDWVIVTRSGPVAFSGWNPALANATVTNNSYAVGRYAYAVYSEDGLLDANVAGYPTNTTSTQYGPKGVSAFADLTAIGMSGVANTGIDGLVGWRNYFSAGLSTTFPNFNFDSTAATNYVNSVVSNTTGFMTIPVPSPTPNGMSRTDQQLPTRQSLIQLLLDSTFTLATRTANANALQDLATVSREVAIPQWSPVTPGSINPNFQALLVTAAFTRNDGTTAAVGDAFVNKRFSLQRLNWLTYKGPSATRTIPTQKPKNATDPDWDMWLLTSRFGLTTTFLQDSVVGGTAANILKYFGLAWDTTNERWNYVGHTGGSLPISSIANLGTLTGTREPDFFELLQAGILNGSLGDAAAADPVLPILHQQSKMLHILTIGANLIAQSRADSYPVRIACTVGATTMEAVGAPRLPYLSSLAACPVAGTGIQGGINWFLVPNLWDPFRDSWDLTEKNVSATLTPNYPRPSVRITVTGSVGFGAIVSSPSVTSGSVPSASVTPFPAVVTISPTPTPPVLTTATPSGRDGFVEASRMGTSDTTPTPAAFVTTVSVSPTPVAQWNNIPYPAPTPNPTPVGQNVVFRISLPGSGIPDTALAQNPVLILKPGFQVTVDYQSPVTSTKWYSYSYLQGNNEPTTWISGSNAANPSLNLATTASVYGRNPAPSPTPPPSPSPVPTARPTILSSGVATPWNVTTLKPGPMFAKADPRSIRYDSQIGVIAVAANTAGVIGSIWPSGYPTPPPMTIASTPTPTATPTPTPTPSVTPTPTPTPSPTPTPTPTPTATPNPPNPATLGDNAPVGNAGNPYNEVNGSSWRPVMMNRPFRSVGEMAYAFRDQPFRTLDFSSANSPDAGLLDLFCVNDYSDTSSRRAGVINLNSRQAPAISALLKSTIQQENIPRAAVPGPSPTPSTLSGATATSVANSLLSSAPFTNRAALTGLSQTLLGLTVPKTEREAIARALGEAGQTRTWNLLIDVVAQSGRYPTSANTLAGFLVEGEQHYWVHIAIDRFTGQVIDKRIEVVNE